MRVLSVILTVVLVLSFAFPTYASSTGSALTFDDQWLFEAAGIQPIEVASVEAQDLRAAAATPSGTQTDPIYVRQSIGDTTVDWFFIDADGEEDDVYENVHGYYSGYEGLSWSITRTLKNLNDRLWYHQVDNGDGTYSENGLLLIERNILGAYVALLEMQPVLNTISTRANTTNTRLTTINTNLTSIITDILAGNALLDWSGITSGGTYTLPRYRQVANGGTTSDLTPVTDARNPISNIWYMANNINTSMVYGLRDLLSGVSVNSTKTYLDKDLQPVSLGRVSLWNDVRMIGGNINDIVARLGYVLASDDEIEARAQAANNQAAIVEGFVDPSGAGSISVSDIGDMAGLSESMKDTFSSNVDPSLIFDGVGSDSHAWDWFTNDVKNSLAYNPSRGSDQLRSAPSADSSTPYLDAYYHDVQEALGVSLW